MQANELLTLMDREADMLAAENNNSAAVLMRAGAAKIRELARPINDACPHGPHRSECTACEPLARLNHR